MAGMCKTYGGGDRCEAWEGCGQTEISGLIICSLLRLVKERLKNRLTPNTLQACQCWHLLYELEIKGVFCPEKQGLLKFERILEPSGLGVVTVDPIVDDHLTARIGAQPIVAVRMVIFGKAPLCKRRA